MTDRARKARSRRRVFSLAGVGLFAALGAQAADLDYPYPHHNRHRPVPPPVAFLPPPPSCKIVQQPQMNLYNEVTHFGVQQVCISRGVYMDSFWPYAPPYWWPNHRQGYGPED